jgi:hypothetical protein
MIYLIVFLPYYSTPLMRSYSYFYATVGVEGPKMALVVACAIFMGQKVSDAL